MNIEKKKKIIIGISIIIAVILIGTAVGVIFKVTNTTSTNVPNTESIETSQEEPLVIPSNPEETEETEETELPEQTIENEEETEHEEEENPPLEEETQTNDSIYYIKVNNQANVVTIYKKDSEGNYTMPYKAMICSIGKATPTGGVYKTYNKYTWRALVGGVYGQYATRIVGSILFHSVPYTSQNKGTLEYWEYDKLGTKASAGCVRLTVEDAKWIYDNCKLGTQVEFYSSADPGPLGKPTAQKISEDEPVRGWDPTDPDSNNPWKTYVKEEQHPLEDNTQGENNNQEGSNSQTENNNQEGNSGQTENNNQEENSSQTENNNQEENSSQTESNNQGGNNEQTENNDQEGNSSQKDNNSQANDANDEQINPDINSNENTFSNANTIKGENITQSSNEKEELTEGDLSELEGETSDKEKQLSQENSEEDKINTSEATE